MRATSILANLALALLAVASPHPGISNEQVQFAGSSVEYRAVKFGVPIASFRDLTTFKPNLPKGWYYLGPVATSDQVKDQKGLIIKPNVPNALAEVLDWKFVGPNNWPEPPAPYSTWRGIAPDGYVVGGDFFVLGFRKPTPQQTKGIRAIRKDLVGELSPHRFIWEGRQPWSVVTLWDLVAAPYLYVPTGAFVSNAGYTAGDRKVPALRFNAW